MDIFLRPAAPADAEAVADVYLASRKAFVAYAPLAHTDPEVRQWITQSLIPSGQVTVALEEERIVGMMAVSCEDGCGWVDHLYIAPGFTGSGIGVHLLAEAKATGLPLRLFTFQANDGARRFYECHGFTAVACSEGQDNEESCPDILYEFQPPL